MQTDENTQTELSFDNNALRPGQVVAIKALVPDRAAPVLVGWVLIAPENNDNRKLNTLKGQIVFYRVQRMYDHFYHRITRTVGCDRIAWELARTYGAKWMITYAQAERRMVMAHELALDRVADFGSGKQTRALIAACALVENCDEWPKPKPTETKTVRSDK